MKCPKGTKKEWIACLTVRDMEEMSIKNRKRFWQWIDKVRAEIYFSPYSVAKHNYAKQCKFRLY